MSRSLAIRATRPQSSATTRTRGALRKVGRQLTNRWRLVFGGHEELAASDASSSYDRSALMFGLVAALALVIASFG